MTFDDYKTELQRRCAYYGMVGNPLDDAEIEELRATGLSPSAAYDVACDVASGYSVAESLGSYNENTKDTAKEAAQERWNFHDENDTLDLY